MQHTDTIESLISKCYATERPINLVNIETRGIITGGIIIIRGEAEFDLVASILKPSTLNTQPSPK